jgi:hypothetical protein
MAKRFAVTLHVPDFQVGDIAAKYNMVSCTLIAETVLRKGEYEMVPTKRTRASRTAKQPTARHLILNHLKDSPKNKSQINSMLVSKGFSENTTQPTLSNMRIEGIITVDDQGWWRIAKQKRTRKRYNAVVKRPPDAPSMPEIITAFLRTGPKSMLAIAQHLTDNNFLVQSTSPVLSRMRQNGLVRTDDDNNWHLC